MGKKFLTADQQEEAGILTAEVKARLAAAYTDEPRRRPRRCRDGVGASGPDGALQPVGGRRRVLQVRRPHGANRQLLHVPRLRHEHRLQLMTDDVVARIAVSAMRTTGCSHLDHRAVREGGPMISGHAGRAETVDPHGRVTIVVAVVRDSSHLVAPPRHGVLNHRVVAPTPDGGDPRLDATGVDRSRHGPGRARGRDRRRRSRSTATRRCSAEWSRCSRPSREASRSSPLTSARPSPGGRATPRRSNRDRCRVAAQRFAPAQHRSRRHHDHARHLPPRP